MSIIRPFAFALTLMTLFSRAQAATLTEDFSSDPSPRGWRPFGDTNLFRWDAAAQNLAVTWDSSRTNSYFYLPLGTILASNDAFSVEFDLRLDDAVAGNYGSQLAVGFLRLADATGPAFARTTGNSPNVAEFDYFPPATLAASVDATLIDRSNNFFFAYDTVPLNPGTVYRVQLAHAAGDSTITGRVFTNGQVMSALPLSYGATAADFRLDVLAVANYPDDGFGDTLLAHGTIDNVVLTLPPPPVQAFTGFLTNTAWRGEFFSQSNWLYTLERSQDLRAWAGVSAPAEGNAALLTLEDPAPPASQAFYRVKAERP